MSKKLVFISGIGADSRAFSKLDFEENLEKIHADWIPIESPRESFQSYADRLVLTYQINSDDILIGLSFGGLIAQYIARKFGNKEVILISTFRSKDDLQPLMKLGLHLKLHKLLPSHRIPIVSDLTAFFLNSWRRESRKLIKAMLKESDFQFINWAITQIGKVDLSSSYSSEYLSFTGTKDLLVRNWVGPNHITIKKGSHFMVYDEADGISVGIKTGKITGDNLTFTKSN